MMTGATEPELTTSGPAVGDYSQGTDVSPASLTADSLAALLEERALNLRQLLLRAHRGLNWRITEKLVARGFSDMKPAHLAVYSNMSLAETPISTLAERAQVVPESMIPLVSELESLGYVRTSSDISDPRQMLVSFTDIGWELMLTSFNVLREVESEYDRQLAGGELEQLRRTLTQLYG
jgi:DNA-binding MarR family transcriptional regulator